MDEERPPGFGARLKRLRRAAGLTQEALAERAGISARAVSDLERGLSAVPQRDTAARLVAALGLAGDAAATALAAAARGRARPRRPPPERARARGGAGPEDGGRCRHNLPLQLTSFIGREHEAAAVRARLAAGRLVTLTGTGGVGKTRLAHRVAAEVGGDFPDGVWLAELAPLADAALVPQTVAAALGVREDPGHPLVATVTEALRPRRLLLVLDNCEHLLDGCARLADALLRACPGLTVLATSREALGIAGETVWRVPALALPDAEHPGSTAALAEAEAVRLFRDRAEAVRPAFRVTDRNAPAVAQICARLDGIPLAIELAAARVRVLPPEQLLTRLADRFRLLTGGSRTALARHRTLRAAVDWSYELLPPAERALFRRLAVFAGGWTLEAAERVCAGDGIPSPAVLDLLTRLADTSLVVVDEAPDGEARYRLLETLRAYALAHLTAHGDAAALRRRHARCYLALAEAAEDQVRTDPMRLHRAEQEHDNCRAALRWLLDHGEAEAGVRFAAAMGPFWAERGHLTEGRRWLAAALAAGAGAPAGVRAKALSEAAGLAGDQHDFAAGRALAAAALALWREADDPRGTAKTLGRLAWLESLLGEREAARRHHEQALALSRELGYTERVAFALHGLGALALGEGDTARARARFQESLALRRDLGLRGMVANTLMSLGTVALTEGDHARATRLYEESLAIGRALGAGPRVARTLNLLGEAARSAGDCERAAALYEESLAISRALGNRVAAAWSLHNLGHARLRRGDPAGAAACFRESLTLSHAHGEPLLRAACLAGFAGVAVGEGRPRRAARLLAVAEVLLRAAGRRLDPTDQAEYGRTLAASRAQLDEQTWAGAWARGQAMPVEQAVAYALEPSPEPPAAPPAQRPDDGVAARAARGRGRRRLAGGLTARQAEVLRLVAEGRTDRQIAAALGLSEETVGRHLSAVYRTLGVASRAAAAAAAVRHGLA